jgi:hypothetical protein
MRIVRMLAGICLTVVVLAPRPVLSQNDVDLAIGFFASGGAYCLRVAPEGVALFDETEWTVMVLTSGQNRSDTFKIRSVDAGPNGMRGGALSASRTAVTGVWRLDGSREAFFDRFASGIEAGILRARVVKVAPPGLAGMTPTARAEAYLKFADRGSRVSFKNTPDLTAHEFRRYATYFPD